MSLAPNLQLCLNIDPKTMTAEEAGAYAAQTIAKIVSDLTASATSTTGSPAHIVGIDKQLARLYDYSPVFAPRRKDLHNGLLALGYEPKLPNSENDPLPAYVSYVDPATGVNFGNGNSETFTVMRGPLRDKLEALPHFGANSRYAYCRLVSDAAVQAVLKVAKDEKVDPTT